MRSSVGFALVAGVIALGATLLTSVRAADSTDATHTIIFFGDSLTAGYGLDDPATEAYPALVQQKLTAAHLPWRAINAGLSGETSAGGLHRIDWVLRQPVDIFFLALGANDGLRGIDPAVTQKNLEQLIDRVRARYPTAKIVVAGMEMPAAMGSDFAQRYHEIFAHVAKDKHARLMPFLLDGVAGRPELNQADAIHPTPSGHRIIADNVWKTLHSLL